MEHVFPKWFYHQDLCFDGKIIRSQEEFDELGKGWVETPALYDVKPIEVKHEEAQSAPEAKEEKAEAKAEKHEGQEEIQIFKKARKGAK